MSRPVPLREIAAHLGRDVEGDPGVVIGGVASLDAAGPGDLGFVRSARYAKELVASRAGALIVPHGLDAAGRTVIRSPHPGLDFARAVAWLEPEPRPEPGVHPAAHVAPDARVAPDASVGPGAVVGARGRVGAGSVLHANATLYHDVVVGCDCVLHAGVVLRERTVLGDRVILQPGVVLGGDGFGYVVNERGAPEKIPQIGRVVVGDDVEIGSNTTVDCGALGDTRIGRGTKIDNLVMIGHNCDIGEGVFIVSQTGLSGSTTVRNGAMIMAQVGVANQPTIGERAFVAARAGVTRDVPPGARVGGFPLEPFTRYQRTLAMLRRLPDWGARLRAVERRLGLRERGSDGGG